MEVIGEIAFRKHIKKIEFFDIPEATNGLLSLIELPEYIDYLYKINARQKTRIIQNFFKKEINLNKKQEN